MNDSVIEFELLKSLVIDTTGKVFDAIIFLLGLIIGSIFYWGIIHYEKLGGDPMKRSLQNKLVAAVSFSVILHHYFFETAWEWRIHIGTLSNELAMVVIYVCDVLRVLFWMGTCEILIYKLLSIYKCQSAHWMKILGRNLFFISMLVFL